MGMQCQGAFQVLNTPADPQTENMLDIVQEECGNKSF